MHGLTTHHGFKPFIDATDLNGDTALHLACRFKNRPLVEMLMGLGASTLIQNKKSITAKEESKRDFAVMRCIRLEGKEVIL